MNKECDPYGRILIIRTDRIGDVVLSLPVVSALRRAFPASHIAMLVHPRVKEVVSEQPDLNAVLYDGPGVRGFFRLVRSLKDGRFDAAVVLHPTMRLALALALARIPVRVGTGYRAYSFLFNRRVYEHRKHSEKHEAEYNLSLARRLGQVTGDVEFRLSIPRGAEDAVDAFLSEKNMTGCRPLVVIHPGSRGSSLDWPVESFSRLAAGLMQRAGACIVVSGSPSETPLAERVISGIPGKIAQAADRFSIKEMTALFGRADLFISNNTGPLHLARAVGTEVIGLYPPLRPVSPRRWGPYARLDSVLVPDLPECKSCKGSRCSRWNCMKTIAVETVLELALKKLSKKSSEFRVPNSE
jgi:ADP-heptose:LPS heptosyltransferase